MDYNTQFLDDVVSTDERKTNFLDDIEGGEGSEDSPRPEHQPEIHFGDSEYMDEVEDESVALVVTSPPYNVDWDYGDHDDSGGYRGEYLPKMSRIFTECYKKLIPGGRLVINVPTLVRQGRKGGRPLASDIIQILTGNVPSENPRSGSGSGLYMKQYESNSIIHPGSSTTPLLALREYIIWNKGFNADGLAPNGSYPRPWGVLLNNMHEAILVFQKTGQRDVSEIDEERKNRSEINKDADDMCDDVWELSPESWDFEDEDNSVPVYPKELPERCIKLWTYEDDTVLDPFGGRGTTCRAAKDNNRHSIMYEKRESLEDEIKEYLGYDQFSLDQW